MKYIAEIDHRDACKVQFDYIEIKSDTKDLATLEAYQKGFARDKVANINLLQVTGFDDSVEAYNTIIISQIDREGCKEEGRGEIWSRVMKYEIEK